MQRSGENVLALVRTLANAPQLVYTHRTLVSASRSRATPTSSCDLLDASHKQSIDELIRRHRIEARVFGSKSSSNDDARADAADTAAGGTASAPTYTCDSSDFD